MAFVGLVLVVAGGVLLYVFHDPHFGRGIMQESFDPKREALGARLGLAMVILGALLQFFA